MEATSSNNLDAENAINATTTAIDFHVDSINVKDQLDSNRTCQTHLNLCHYRGQCVLVDEQWKCL
jgi:hypothetical protein